MGNLWWATLRIRQIGSFSSWSPFLPILAVELWSEASHRIKSSDVDLWSQHSDSKAGTSEFWSARSTKWDHLKQMNREKSIISANKGKGRWGPKENTSSAVPVPLKQFPFWRRSWHLQGLQSHTWALEGEAVSFQVPSSALREELSKAFLK